MCNWLEMLILLGIPYGSPQSITIAREVMRFVQEVATTTSEELARQRGNQGGYRRVGTHRDPGHVTFTLFATCGWEGACDSNQKVA